MMKKEELLIFSGSAIIMSVEVEENNEVAEADYNHHESEQDKRFESSDEGCCILPIREEAGNNCVRRVKSTPNLLQIPSPIRNRKKSDDSALGSAEEFESDKSSSAENSPTDHHVRVHSTSEEGAKESLTNRIGIGIEGKLNSNLEAISMTLSVESSSNRISLLRPPSVVVSDHDLIGEETYLTLDDLDAEYNQRNPLRRLSDCSTCSSFSLSSDFDFNTSGTPPGEEQEENEEPIHKTSRWRTIRTIVHQLTPFIQKYKNQRYPWVQLAGHQGNFKAGWQQGTILKKFCAREKDSFELLMKDALAPFVPQYYGLVNDEEHNEFLQLEDLLGQFKNPCVMDCKLGVRTYLEEELMKAKEKPKLRKDMYEKMLQIDPNAPLPEEHQVRGVTKPRYMVWRETISTTAMMGFRIEGIRKSDGTSSKDFKTVRSEDKVKEAFFSFVDGFSDSIQQYLDRLHALRAALLQSQFFATHEVIGSSLLFVHDSERASVWMIDFAKTVPLPNGVAGLRHSEPWVLGNHEDGYLIGLSNLIQIFEEILQK